MMIENVDSFKKIITDNYSFIITTHRGPDGDAMGSSMAMYNLLLNLKKDVNVIIPNSFPNFLSWLPNIKNVINHEENNSDISMVQPNITFPDGSNQFLCKRNPTFLAQFIRAFLPRFLFKKFNSYNSYYEMRDLAYKKDPVLSTYLSGCFMFCRRSSLEKVNWFYEKYFMYLEDADLQDT